MNTDSYGGRALTWTITALLVLVFLLGVPFGIVLLITVIAAPAVAEQVQLDPCSAQPAGTSNVTGLPAPDGARRASLHNPPLPIPDRIKNLYVAGGEPLPPALATARRGRDGRDRPRTQQPHQQRRRAGPDAVHASNLRPLRRRRQQ